MNFFQYLRPSQIPERSRPRSVLEIRREIILQQVLNTLLVLYTIGFPVVLIAFPQAIRVGSPVYFALPYLLLALITLYRRIPYPLRAFVLLLALIGLGAAALLAYGLAGTGVIFLLGASVMANILFSQRVGGFITTLSLALMILVGGLMVTGRLAIPPLNAVDISGRPTQWAVAGMVFLFIMALLISSLANVLQGMNQALQAQEKLTQELTTERSSLERRVEERSQDLKKRINQFEVASQIARQISGETDLESLLNTAVSQIRDQFGFYHVGIFVNDEKNEYAILRAATGEAGRAMLERNHRLKVGEIGMVGYVVSRGEARISMDVSGDIVHYKNPLLPETRSEMVLPLRLGARTIGALDVQSVVPDAFHQEDTQILQTIADQLAIAFEKTNLVDNLRRTVSDLENTDRAATQKAWRTHLRSTRQKLAYRYRDSQLENQVDETVQAQEAVSKGNSVLRVVSSGSTQGKPVSVLAVPIKLRNQVLGVVDIQFESANVSPDLIGLIEGTVNRLAVSLENARLLEEIQYRAERERLVGEISSKVRAASDVDTVLRVAIQEIGKSLGVSEVMVQLRKDM